MLCLVAQSWLTLCDAMDCSLPGTSVHGDSPGRNTGVGFHMPCNPPSPCHAQRVTQGAATGGVGGGAGAPGPAAAPKMGGWEDGLQPGLSSRTPPLARLPEPPSPPFPAAVLEAGGGWLTGVCFLHGAPCWPSCHGLRVSPSRVGWLWGPFRKCLCDASGMSLPADFLSWRNLRPPGI